MNHEIKLYGPIDSMWNSAEEIIGGIPADAKEITMRIHSPGGSVGEGLAIYNALKDHPAKVTTIVDGYAASTASFVMLAGDVRQVHRNSIIFVHNPWTVAQGDASDLRTTADGLDVHGAAIQDIYETETGMSAEDAKSMMEDTLYFRGVDAKDNGFATEIIDDVVAENKIAAMLDFDGFVAQTKEAEMSKQKLRKEIEADLVAKDEELVQSRADLDALKIASDENVVEIEAKHVEDIAAKDVELEAVKAESVELKSSVEALEANLVEITASLETMGVEFEASKVEADEAKAELVKAQETLKNPAVKDAQLADVDADGAPQPNADTEADEAEAKAKLKDGNDDPIDIRDEYERMESGVERIKFLDENKKAIFACKR